MKLSIADAVRWCGVAATDVDDESHDQVGQIEAPVESVGERAEVSIGVLGVPESLVGSRQHRLEVAQHGVDPLELRQICGLRRPTISTR